MLIKGFECANEEKLNRAIFGTMGREGKLEGGVGEGASDELKLAAYDYYAGLILKGLRKVKTGCFCDFAESKKQGKVVAFEKPEVILLINDLEGNAVEIAEDEELMPELVAAEKIAEKKKRAKLAEVAEKEQVKAEKKAKKAKKNEELDN